MNTDLTAIVTFHREGLLAHATLRSYLLARNRARERGIDVQMLLILDNADHETAEVVRNHPDLAGDELILDTSAGDCGLARNIGVSHSSGTYVCTLDGDDLISRDYFQRHVEYARNVPDSTILHAELVVSFGGTEHYSHQLNPVTMPFSNDLLMVVNPWISAIFARREVLQQIPYVACFPRLTGYGFEDWHWACQTLAAGLEHRVVPETAYFYRVKSSGSMNQNSAALRAVVPPTRLFGSWGKA
ncbi:glycosyltransferase [Stenotrophomonas pavanii]|uniref:glycosyltransferase n=1 Tax=Stenotrophomonas pavanii TaxID=487698 RepID=UPI00131107BE|nr:glycosyltransferase [Stenotrophomonas pavanii]MDT3457104.1 glycosyltransferase [Stenotrophomonas pavanii]MDT3464415.1 glycosyltransferase [Stenotrophomonas pavanii]